MGRFFEKNFPWRVLNDALNICVWPIAFKIPFFNPIGFFVDFFYFYLIIYTL
ncbi:hypothetical protein HanIR_Chr03g0106961 [Helianthus annuus]|nr:hypothetical protein HanIR_Chr03g0106961 [Helianthus annuus]